jgi:ribosomal protein L4
VSPKINIKGGVDMNKKYISMGVKSAPEITCQKQPIDSYRVEDMTTEDLLTLLRNLTGGFLRVRIITELNARLNKKQAAQNNPRRKM